MRIIVFVVMLVGIGVAVLWTSRTNAPHISEAQADAVALDHTERIYHRPSQVVSAQFFADGGKSESKPGENLPGQDCALPIDICPPTPLWVVRVRTQGFPDSYWTIDATNSAILQEVSAH
jgi:hypothetical protein